MNTRTIVFATLALGATALGGVLIFNAGTDRPAQTISPADQQPQQIASSSFFDEPSTELVEEPTREINAQNASGANQPARAGFAGMLDRMNEFDADGDGILSSEERQAMREAIWAEMQERFDLDGDGELSREERMAMRQAMFEQSPRGQELMRQFDKDGNGVLDEQEQAAMDAYQQQQREQRRADDLARYDSNGDGELSRQERQAQREEQRGRRDNMMRDAVNEFDRDGDGQLSIEESQEAFAVFQERREIDRFINDYDRDGDGAMGAADYSDFLASYERGDLHADVNHDGTVNSQDLAAYTDMVTRSRNRP